MGVRRQSPASQQLLAVNSNTPDLHNAREKLREGIKTSRRLVRQSRLLIELSECDRAPRAGGDEYAVVR